MATFILVFGLCFGFVVGVIVEHERFRRRVVLLREREARVRDWEQCHNDAKTKTTYKDPFGPWLGYSGGK